MTVTAEHPNAVGADLDDAVAQILAAGRAEGARRARIREEEARKRPARKPDYLSALLAKEGDPELYIPDRTL